MTDFNSITSSIETCSLDQRRKRAQSLVGTSAGRPADDFYPTPPEATQALLDVERFDGLVWEPACGDGAISRVLEANGYRVLSTDLIDRGYGEGNHDFFTSPHKADHIVTNPPFILAEQFVRHALTRSTGKVAMLCKLAFLEGAKRKPFFAETPLKSVYVFSKRVSFYRNGEKGDYSSSMIAFAWYVWEHGHEGEPVLRWI